MIILLVLAGLVIAAVVLYPRISRELEWRQVRKQWECRRKDLEASIKRRK